VIVYRDKISEIFNKSEYFMLFDNPVLYQAIRSFCELRHVIFPEWDSRLCGKEAGQ